MSSRTAEITLTHSRSISPMTRRMSSWTSFGDVPPDTAHEVRPIRLPVARDPLHEPHDGFAHPPGLHEDGVESQDVAREAEPEKVAVDALQLEDDGTDVLGARRGLHARGVLHRLDVGGGMHHPADAADPFPLGMGSRCR